MSTTTNTQPLALTAKAAAALLGISERHLWTCSKTVPGFPKPFQIGGRCTRWRRADIEAWLQSLTPGTTVAK